MSNGMNHQTTLTEVPIDEISPHPENRRVGGFDEESLGQLAESIKTHGVLHPPLVREIANGYELVAGERRWRAAKLAGYTSLDCDVRDVDDAELLEIQVIENLHREDVHPIDECDGYHRLLEHGYEPARIAGDVGQSESYVRQRLKLKALIEPIREKVIAGTVPVSHAVLVARLNEKQQNTILNNYFQAYNDERPVPLRQLKSHIEEKILTSLGSAPFSQKDTELFKKAGACVECPKRTGYEPELFPEVGQRENCTDPACYKSKCDNLLKRRRAELDEAGTHYVLVQPQGEYAAMPDGSVDNHSWEPCKEGDRNAVRVVYAGGAQKGRLAWGKLKKQPRVRGGTQRERAERERERRESEIFLRTQTRVRRMVGEQLVRRYKSSGQIEVDVLRTAVIHVAGLADGGDDDEIQQIFERHGWEPKRSDEHWMGEAVAKRVDSLADANDLQLLLTEFVALDLPTRRFYAEDTGPSVTDRLAERFGVDVAAITQEVTQEIEAEEASESAGAGAGDA